MGVFDPGVGGQPMAPLFGAKDGDWDAAPDSVGAGTYQHRIPLVIRAANGDVLAFTERRESSQDYSAQAITMRRSTDNGLNWGEVETVYYRTDYTRSNPTYRWLTLGSVVLHRQSGKLVLLFSKSDTTSGGAAPTNQVMTLFVTSSTDHGATWAAPSEITSSIKKTNATTPVGLQAWYQKTNAAWGWYAFGPGTGLCLDSGRLVVLANHRYTTDQSGPSWTHSIISDDAGVTWSLAGGFDESVATNDYTNEASIVLMQSGNYLVNCRFASGGNSTRRGQTTVSDLTAAWTDVSLTSDGSASLTANSCQGSLLAGSNGDVLLICPGDSLRSRLTVYRSTNFGISFPQKQVLWYGYSGYSAPWEISSGRYGVVFEATDDFLNADGTDAMGSAQFVRLARFSSTWFNGEVPAVAHYLLNDGVAGVATATDATQIGCWNGWSPPGKGGSAATWHADGLSFGGSGNGVQLQEAMVGVLGGICDPGLDDITYEFDGIIQSGSGTAQTLFDNRNASGKGVTIGLDTSHFWTFTVHDGTNACTCTQSVPIAGASAGDDVTAHFTYKRGTGVTIRISDGSLFYAAASAADNLTSTVPVFGSQVARLGSRANGTSPLISGSIVHQFKVTRKALTDGELMPQAQRVPKPTAAAASGFVASSLPTVPSTSALKLAAFAPFFSRADGWGSQDRWGGLAWPLRPARGAYVGSYYDQIAGKRLTTNSAFRSPRWDYDSDFGWHVRPSIGTYNTGSFVFSQTSVSFFQRPAADSDLDFVQTTGTFTILLAVKVISDATGTSQVLADNALGTTSQNGFSIHINNSTRTANLLVARGSAGNARFNEAASGALTLGQWYLLGWVGQGAAAKVKHYRATWTSRVLSAISSADSTANMDSTAGGAATSAMGLMARVDQNRGADVRLGPFLMFNTALDASAIAAWAAVMNQIPTIAGVSVGGGRRNRPGPPMRRLSSGLLGR